MAMGTNVTGLKGELLYAHYMRQEGSDVTRTVMAKEVAGWLHEVALQAARQLEKPTRTPSPVWKTVLTPLREPQGSLMDAGMRKGDAKTLMRNMHMSEKCTPLGGDDSSFNPGFRPHLFSCVWDLDI